MNGRRYVKTVIHLHGMCGTMPLLKSESMFLEQGLTNYWTDVNRLSYFVKTISDIVFYRKNGKKGWPDFRRN